MEVKNWKINHQEMLNLWGHLGAGAGGLRLKVVDKKPVDRVNTFQPSMEYLLGKKLQVVAINRMTSANTPDFGENTKSDFWLQMMDDHGIHWSIDITWIDDPVFQAAFEHFNPKPVEAQEPGWGTLLAAAALATGFGALVSRVRKGADAKKAAQNVAHKMHEELKHTIKV